MEPITIGVLGFGAYMLLKNGIGGGASAKVPDFAVNTNVDRLVLQTNDGGLAQGPSLFHFECDMQPVGFFASNPAACLVFIARNDLSITDQIWGAGLFIGDVSAAPGANPKACAISWDPNPHWYPETASDQVSDGALYHLVLESAVSAGGQRYLRYVLSQGGQVLRDTGLFPDMTVYDPKMSAFTIAQLFGTAGNVRFTNASYRWSKYTGT